MELHDVLIRPQIWDKFTEAGEDGAREVLDQICPEVKAKRLPRSPNVAKSWATEAYCHAVYGSLAPPTLPTGGNALLLKFRKPTLEYLPEQG
eukprot:8093109-Pyramimonas_sp.AAC.2